MENSRQIYIKLREELESEMYSFQHVVGRTTEEDPDSYVVSTALETINETCKKLLAQIKLYQAFAQLKVGMKEMSETIPTLYWLI